MSLESLRFMLGGAIKKDASANSPIVVRHTAEVVCTTGGTVPKPVVDGVTMTPTATAGHPIKLINLTTGARTQIQYDAEGDNEIDGVKAISFKNPKLIGGSNVATASGDHIRIFWEEVLTGAQSETETAVEVTISPDTFPGTYRVIGDTFMRSEKTGKDEPFQFVINKAKQILAA